MYEVDVLCIEITFEQRRHPKEQIPSLLQNGLNIFFRLALIIRLGALRKTMEHTLGGENPHTERGRCRRKNKRRFGIVRGDSYLSKQKTVPGMQV